MYSLKYIPRKKYTLNFNVSEQVIAIWFWLYELNIRLFKNLRIGMY